MRVPAIIFVAVLGSVWAQFPGGRILEGPVPSLCAQRVIHERTPDGKYFFNIRKLFTEGE